MTLPWHASGLLVENCNCQLICPGHVHFTQDCTHERCVGWWAIRFDDGAFGAVPLAGSKAVVAYDSPRRMIDGGWTEVILVDEEASAEARDAIEAILSGRAGGPWEVLSRFVERRLPTRSGRISIDAEGKLHRVRVAGLLEATVEDHRGRDRERPVTFENMFNQIHAPHQVIAAGSGRYDDGAIVVDTDGTHALHSRFRWEVSGG